MRRASARGRARACVAAVVGAGALSCTGCIALEELTHGVSIWPFVLGTEVQVEELATLRGTQVVVVAVQVDEAYDLVQLPVTGAEVQVTGPDGASASCVERHDGVYVVTALEAPGLVYQVDGHYEVRVTADGAEYTASARAASPLDTQLVLEPHPAGQPRVIEFPAGYADEYDQVLAWVADAQGTRTWSNQPESADAWLEFAATTYTPEQLEIPGEAFPAPDTLYGVALLGAVRAREGATFSDSLTSRLSGFTTGPGYALPLWAEESAP